MTAPARLAALLRTLPERRGPIASCWTVPGAHAAVTVTCTDPAVVEAVDRLVTHTWLATGPSAGWRVDAIEVGPRVLHAAGFAFAGAPVAQVRQPGPGHPPVRYLRAGAKALFCAEGDHTLIHADPLGVVRVFTSDQRAALAWVPVVARQVMTLQLLLGGAVHAHAAAVVVRGVGVLIAGPRGSGKTSAALAAVQLLGGDLVGADRILLAPPSPTPPAPTPSAPTPSMPTPSMPTPSIPTRPRSTRSGRPPGHAAMAITGGARSAPGRSTLVGYRWPAPIMLRTATVSAHPRLGAQLGTPDPGIRPEYPVVVDPGRAGRLLAGGRLRDRVTPGLVLMPELAFHLGPATVSAPARVDPAHLHSELVGTGMFLRDAATGTVEDVETWLTDPAGPGRAGPRDGRREWPAGVHRVAGALAELPCHRLGITRDPAGISRQIAALLPAARPRRPP